MCGVDCEQYTLYEHGSSALVLVVGWSAFEKMFSPESRSAFTEDGEETEVNGDEAEEEERLISSDIGHARGRNTASSQVSTFQFTRKINVKPTPEEEDEKKERPTSLQPDLVRRLINVSSALW